MKLLLLELLAVFGLAQTPYQAPRTSWGDPDLQGTYSNTWRTPLERKRLHFRSVYATPEERDAFEKLRHSYLDKYDYIQRGRVKELIGCEAVYLDTDQRMAVINGKIRASWIVDPADGRIPYTEEGREIFDREIKKYYNVLDGPEDRWPAERCLVGYGSVSGPPMLNVDYNSNYQIFQSPGYVAIVVEMNHDARIIRIGGEYLPSHIRPWMGDSIGHWEGNTLVVRTKNINPQQKVSAGGLGRYYISPDSKITERFTRISATEIFYEFTVDDPKFYTQPWRAEMLMYTIDGPLYEYACAEGDKSLGNTLAGARRFDKLGIQRGPPRAMGQRNEEIRGDDE